MEELRKEAKALKDLKKYDQAILLYAKIYSADSDRWLAWEYVDCLKNLGEIDKAIEISKKTYLKNKDFKYNNDILSWLLYEKYFKTLKNVYNTEEVKKLYAIAMFVTKIVKQDDKTPYFLVVLKMLKIFKISSDNLDEKTFILLDKLNVNKLSEIPHVFLKNNQKREYQSDREMYFAYKTKTLYHCRRYDDCINCCEEALLKVNKFHHDNEIWIQSRKALCLGEKGNIESAIKQLLDLLLKKRHWNFLYDIGKLYLLKDSVKINV